MLAPVVRLAAGLVAVVSLSGVSVGAQPSATAPLPLVYVLSTGGTISGKGATSTSLADYQSGALLGSELIAAVPEIAQVARVKVEQIANVSSTDITIANWLTLANRINVIYDSRSRRWRAWSSPTAPTPSKRPPTS